MKFTHARQIFLAAVIAASSACSSGTTSGEDAGPCGATKEACCGGEGCYPGLLCIANVCEFEGSAATSGSTQGATTTAVTGATSSGSTTSGTGNLTTSGAVTTSAGATTHGATTSGSTTVGATTVGSTTSGNVTTASSTTVGATTVGSTTSGATSTHGATTSGNGTTSGSSTSGGGTTSGGVVDGGPFLTVPLTGCALVGFNAPVSIAGQMFQMDVDTGSTDTGIALSTCSDCGVTPEYTPASGSCSGSTSSQFGSGSWDAQICSAVVSVGGEMPDVTIDFAGITDQQQFFINANCAEETDNSFSQGILGMGPLDLDTIGMSSDDAYFNELVTKGITDTLGILLCSNDGYLWFGGYDTQYASGAPQYTAITSSGYWSVDNTKIGLGTTDLGAGNANTVVDTGTYGFLMPTAAFNAFTTAIAADTGATTVFGSGTLNSSFFSNVSCASPLGGQTQAQIDAALPPLTMTFPSTGGGSFTLTMPATQSYLYPVTQSGVTEYCGLVADGESLGAVIMGATTLRAYITVLDEGNNQVGFAPQTVCE